MVLLLVVAELVVVVLGLEVPLVVVVPELLVLLVLVRLVPVLLVEVFDSDFVEVVLVTVVLVLVVVVEEFVVCEDWVLEVVVEGEDVEEDADDVIGLPAGWRRTKEAAITLPTITAHTRTANATVRARKG